MNEEKIIKCIAVGDCAYRAKFPSWQMYRVGVEKSKREMKNK